jgi:hypothetical protein
MGKLVGLSAEASKALSTSYATFTLDADTTADSSAARVPTHCTLGMLVLTLDTIAGGATTLTYFLSVDSSGDVPITNETTTDITTGKTTATDGGVAGLINAPYRHFSAGTAEGKLYVHVKTDAGTANCIARLTWFVDNSR